VNPTDYNLALARAILEAIEPFLQSTDAFWPLTAAPPSSAIPFPRLSLGAFLLTLDELRAAEAQAATAVRPSIQSVEREFDRIHQKWRVAVENKALAEAPQRLSIWRAYLEDLNDGRGDPAGYSQEVRQRVILTRLLQTARGSSKRDETLGRVGDCDAILRGLFVPREFVWDPRLRPVYPEKDFWFLYGEIRT
jgi:hypothetical protein